MNTETKKFILTTSPNSINLFFALANMKKKGLYYDDINENNQIDIIYKENIMDSVCELFEGEKKLLGKFFV